MIAKSEQIDTLAGALVKAQAKFTPAGRSATNPHLKNRYATLGDTWDACRDALHANGLTVVQTFDAQDDAGIVLVTTLLHTSGQWISSALRMPLEKPSAQAVGSATTYARRYGLAALVGVVVDDDDDGTVAASHAPAQARTPASRPAPNGNKSAGDKVMPFGKHKGTKLRDVPPADLESTIKWATEKDADKFADLIVACRTALGPTAGFDEMPPSLLDEDDDLPFDR